MKYYALRLYSTDSGDYYSEWWSITANDIKEARKKVKPRKIDNGKTRAFVFSDKDVRNYYRDNFRGNI